MIAWLTARSGDVQVGLPAPDFTLKDEHGKEHTLSDYLGKRVVVYFFPKAETPG
ncbi:MAG: redoxin domain-containing protein [Candidatus Marinimicrobia bacterium]|nr:redoxin domain-containing protein [Candidatus Neomarinimicrobiota bacterium]MBT3618230.1 redoxin domain-containing protein [Candidatus Neomarinimicrobiota bacterium]MBT3829556.1 redoxin domain-containing protein [Candidatus Neomarinimicrobiota bacterium]MBT3997439.1 redoxin domain-containing protein [Candidatus Neomarinimicrobiota bacterium]MBT4281629.1 redoxin domain-containing protein [Candidatus Neomarinimicrobiota bacterium]